jgi:predicted N-acyltransferase
MSAVLSSPQIQTARATVRVAKRSEIEQSAAWTRAFAHLAKDHRYYEIVEDTILQGFEYRYFVLEDADGGVRACQPFFVLDQDLVQGAGPWIKRTIGGIRKLIPRFLKLRTLMIGCAAGEGHLESVDESRSRWIIAALRGAAMEAAREHRASLIVFKEFSAEYRQPMAELTREAGYTRVPSLPSTRLSIDYPDFETYMAKALSKVTRKGLRRKFKAAAEGATISMEVVDDVTPYVDEAHALYLNVFNRSPLQFEKLTKEYLCEIGRRMPDKARFFLWRRDGKMVAFSFCLLNGDALHDEYLGLDYSIALDLHLYFYTLRDTIDWAIKNGCKWFCSSGQGYDPKLHLKFALAPVDLYVRHRWAVANFILRRVLPWVEPTRSEKTLREYEGYDALWGDA